MTKQNTADPLAGLGGGLVLIWMMLAPALLAAPPAKIALDGARIIPIVGDEISRGTLIIENGRITAIGEKVDVPYDAMVVDVSGKVLFPGMIDAHSSRGLDVPNENLPVTPFLDVYDALDPSRVYFEDALRDGITSVHVIVDHDCVIGGLSRVVHPIGLTPDAMTLDAQTALKLSVAAKTGSDRMVQMATFRETFSELAEYLGDLAETKYEESLKNEDKPIDVGPEEARKRGQALIRPEHYDDKHRNLVKLTRGELNAFVWCALPGDFGRAVRLAQDNGFIDRTTFVLGPECFKAVKEIKEADRPVVLDPELVHREKNPFTGEMRETFVPGEYAKAGIPFSILPSPSASLAERYLNYQAARCVRNGISRKKALDAITINPAKALGLKDRIGSLEVGKMANVVVFSGDPLDFNTWVELVYINGIRAYDRNEDVRLKELLGEERKEVAAVPAASDSPAPPAAPATEPSDSLPDETDPGNHPKPDPSDTE